MVVAAGNDGDTGGTDMYNSVVRALVAVHVTCEVTKTEF